MSRDSLTSSLTLHEVAVRCGVEVGYVERLVTLGVIEAHPGSAPSATSTQVLPGFSPEVTLRVARVVRLERDLGVNFEGAAVILDLLDRIERLEDELRSLRGR
jgi:hypothetical protein